MKVTPLQVQNNYNKLKGMAVKAAENDNIEEALICAEVAADIMYTFCLEYFDTDLERVLQKAADNIKTADYKNEASSSMRVTFLDSFAIDNRGLTLIYVKALAEIGCKIQFITYEENKNQMEKIKSVLEHASEKAEISFVNKKKSFCCAQNIADAISSFKPDAILMHILPDDTRMLVAAAAFKDKAVRYMINITDHSFWLGQSILDYSIEFREYGCNVSKQYRGISAERIVLLPYYPAPTEKAFEGFDFDTQNKKIVFSGGSVYKTSGSDIYWKIIKHILDNNSDAIFMYAGSGDKSEMLAFIKNNKYENRFHIIEERGDLDEVMKRCTVYLSTYPFIGGLMAQYAVANGKIPLTYASEHDANNQIKPLFVRTGDEKLEYSDIQLICDEADKLLQNAEYRKSQEAKWTRYLITPSEFSQQLKNVLLVHKSEFEYNNIKIDVEARIKTNFDGTVSNAGRYGTKLLKCGFRSIIAFPKEIFIAVPYITQRIWCVLKNKISHKL